MKHLFRQHRPIIILAGLLALGLISGTIAWLSSLSSATNSFTVGTVDVTVTESFDDYVKSNVGAQNSGNTPIYVRAAVIASLVNNTTGVVTGEEPVVGRDYSITYGNSTNWQLGSDGYYYYLLPLASNATTDNLIDRAEQLIEYSDRSLHIEIATQAIQAEPSTAVAEAWGVTVNANGTINPPQS